MLKKLQAFSFWLSSDKWVLCNRLGWIKIMELVNDLEPDDSSGHSDGKANLGDRLPLQIGCSIISYLLDDWSAKKAAVNQQEIIKRKAGTANFKANLNLSFFCKIRARTKANNQMVI